MSSAAQAASSVQPQVGSPTGLPRLLAGLRGDRDPEPLRSHVDRYGPVGTFRGQDLLRLLESSGLTGRGGAGFPTGSKLRTVAATRRRAVMLANGAEADPTSGKDRALLRSVPHLVLDGAVLAADALGANEVFVAVGERALRERSALDRALTERAHNGTDAGTAIRVVPVPTGFVTGEETAVVQFVNGGPSKPTFTPPRPFERGIGGAPTLVLNVETFAHVALIARFGSDWFRELGTSREPGSKLATITGAVRRPGVHELALGTPLARVVEAAGGLTGQVSAFLVGGYFGTWLRPETVLDLRFLDDDLSPLGASLGACALVALPASTCALGEVSRVARYLSRESAGQCGPCVNGLGAIADGLERLAAGLDDDRAHLARWVDVVRGRGACRHPDGATQFVSSALDVFADEVRTHLRYGRCRAQTAGVLPVPRADG